MDLPRSGRAVAPTLVILAAGLGRRFGGFKQLIPVGPDGSTILDYTLFDAHREGCGRAVIVVRHEIRDRMQAHLGRGAGLRVPVTLVGQELTDIPGAVPAGRARPWGTLHAVLAARDEIDGPFVVVNADDFYGRPALAAVIRHLRTETSWCLAGYRALDTLPDHGGVSRGLVQARGGRLEAIREVHGLRRHADGAVWDAPDGPRVVAGDHPVSMNLWGLGAAAMPQLEAWFARFLAARPDNDSESYLPEAVSDLVAAGRAEVTVLPVRSPWCGITATQDLDSVRAFVERLVDGGGYPPELWA